MKYLAKSIAAGIFALCANNAFSAPPAKLITHNNTNDVSRAMIANVVPSTHPAHPGYHEIAWIQVKLACTGHITNNKCPATIRMEKANGDIIAANIAEVALDMITGEIQVVRSFPKTGYSFKVLRVGEVSINKL